MHACMPNNAQLLSTFTFLSSAGKCMKNIEKHRNTYKTEAHLASGTIIGHLQVICVRVDWRKQQVSNGWCPNVFRFKMVQANMRDNPLNVADNNAPTM